MSEATLGALEVWFATTNSGKLSEFKSLLAPYKANVHGVHELKVFSSPPETGKTFLENARIKARALAATKPGYWVVADDSGLEVEGLDKLPGIHSARYAGPKASDAENVAKLLKMMALRCPQKRDAVFRCALMIYSPQAEEIPLEGEVKGTIHTKADGKGGFGYDPVFIPQGESLTFSQLGAAKKNQLSHRAQAFRKLLKFWEDKQLLLKRS